MGRKIEYCNCGWKIACAALLVNCLHFSVQPAFAYSYDDIVNLVNTEHRILGNFDSKGSLEERLRSVEECVLGVVGTGSFTERLERVRERLAAEPALAPTAAVSAKVAGVQTALLSPQPLAAESSFASKGAGTSMLSMQLPCKPRSGASVESGTKRAQSGDSIQPGHCGPFIDAKRIETTVDESGRMTTSLVARRGSDRGKFKTTHHLGGYVPPPPPLTDWYQSTAQSPQYNTQTLTEQEPVSNVGKLTVPSDSEPENIAQASEQLLNKKDDGACPVGQASHRTDTDDPRNSRKQEFRARSIPSHSDAASVMKVRSNDKLTERTTLTVALARSQQRSPAITPQAPAGTIFSAICFPPSIQEKSERQTELAIEDNICISPKERVEFTVPEPFQGPDPVLLGVVGVSLLVSAISSLAALKLHSSLFQNHGCSV